MTFVDGVSLVGNHQRNEGCFLRRPCESGREEKGINSSVRIPRGYFFTTPSKASELPSEHIFYNTQDANFSLLHTPNVPSPVATVGVQLP